MLRRALPVLACSILLSLSATRASAASIGLVIAIDTSGSVDATEFDLQRQAYASFFSTYANAFAGKDVAVTVLYWAGEGVQHQAVPWTALSSAADAQSFSSAIQATSRPDISGLNAAQTGVARALTTATALFAQSPIDLTGASLVIDISGDGTENLDFDQFVTHVLDTVSINVPTVPTPPNPIAFDVGDPWQAVFTARQNALAQGILINALPIVPVPPVQAVEVQDSGPAIDFFPAPGFTFNNQAIDISAEWAVALQGLGYHQTTLLELFYGRVIGSPDSRVPFMVVANGFSAQELSDKISLKLAQELDVVITPEPSLSMLIAGSAALLVALQARRRAR